MVINARKLDANYLKLIAIIAMTIDHIADFSSIVVMAILSMYKNRGNLWKQCSSMMMWLGLYAVISFIFVNKVYGVLVLFSILVYPILRLYDGTKGNTKLMKWFFYLYYPLHLIIIGMCRVIMYGNISLLFK